MVERARLPSLAAIGAFEAAARHGSFAAAARELGTSAASVSYHVRQLERAIDTILFRRFPHRVELSRAGEAIAHETIGAFETLRASFVRGSSIDGRHVSITALPTFGVSWLTPRLGRLRDRYGGMEIELDLSPEPRDLGSGRFDAAIRNGHGNWPGLRSLLLFPSIFTPLCAPSLASSVKSLEGELPLLGRPDWWELWFRALGRNSPRSFGIQLAEEHLDAVAAIAGHGITIGSPILFRREIEAGRLVLAHELVVGDGRSFWLTYPAVRRATPKIRRLEQWLADEAAEERSASRRFLDAAVMIET
jgi:LysR family transcriptional regulator, glycine cleavage system transcriptional activator